MGIFKRIFNITKAEANAVVDNLENPIKMTEQGLRELREDFDKSIKALAEVKAMSIRAKNEVETLKSSAVEYENKAIMLIKRAEDGSMAVEEADRLATASLQKKEEILNNLRLAQTNHEKYAASVAKLEANIQLLKTNISKWENEAKMLKARAKVSEATANVNKQLSGIDSSGTVAMLERMKEKVENQEALAESYGEIANSNKSLDEEINSALENTSLQSSSSALTALKEKMKNKELGDGTNVQ